MPLWDETCSVSVPEMDRHHQRLLDLLNQVNQAIREQRGMDEISTILSEASDYTRTHFEAEEHMLEAYGYPDLHQQKVQHIKFVREIEALRVQYKNEDWPAPVLCTSCYESRG